MRRIIQPLALLFSAVLLFASCLKDNDDDVVYYDDTAITAFSLGTLKYTVQTTTSSGKDSSIVSQLDCSSFKFYIDQQRKLIYNPDSLPVGIDITKVLASITSKNAGTVVYQKATSDTLYYFSSSDSIDFSQPLKFRVYNTMGTFYREYTIKVNVHREVADSFAWRQVTTSNAIAGLQAMKSVAMGGHIFVFGLQQGRTVGYRTDETDGMTWKQLSQEFSAEAYKSAVAFGGQLFVLSEGTAYSSTDGETWTAIQPSSSLRQLTGASNTHLYAISATGSIMSSTDAASWTDEGMLNDASYLPVTDISFVTRPLTTNSNSNQLLIIGNRDTTAYPNDAYAMVWGKIEENEEGSENQSWTLFSISDDNAYATPRLQNLQTVAYDNGIVAIGGRGEGTLTTSPFSKVYKSTDNALTWHEYGELALPETFNSSETSFALVKDSRNYLWIFCGQSGQVWRGRINRLGWTQEQKEFTK